MNAFHNDTNIKNKYLNRVMAHFDADELIKGKFWEHGKGCAVGCTIHSSEHAQYEVELGIPEWLARVEDKIFEGLPNGKAKEWPVKFLAAIHVGADLEKVKSPFLIFILESTLQNFDHAKNPLVKKAIDDVIELHKQENVTAAAWSAAWSAAAWSAAESAASSAASSAAWSAAWSAASSAAWSAASSAASSAAESAASSAAESAASSAAESAAESAASSAAYEKFADKLLELLVNCR